LFEATTLAAVVILLRFRLERNIKMSTLVTCTPGAVPWNSFNH
jgi:hypothetical protein